MHTNRVTLGFIAILVTACCLVLGGLAAPTLAKTIVVTTLADTADPPFDDDGLCSTGTVSQVGWVTTHPTSDGTLVIDPDRTGSLFEVSIVPPLAEYLNFILPRWHGYSDGGPCHMPMSWHGMTMCHIM